jgi:hypothetical protein
MQPDFNTPIPTQNPNKWSRKQVFILLGVIIGILVLWLAWTGVQATYFRMSGTDPGLGSVTTVTPYIHAKFNRVLSGDNLKISDPDKVLENYGLNDKVLELNLNLDKLKQGDKHTIVIESIQSKDGDKITNKKLSFTVKEGDFESLNDDQKNIVVNRQDRFVYSPETITFEGTDDLIDAGLSESQLIGMQEAVYHFSKKDNKEFDTVQIFRTSITHLENTDPVKATTAFTAEIDGVSYAMQVDTWDITIVQLRVYDPQTNALLFTSDPIDKASEQ